MVFQSSRIALHWAASGGHVDIVKYLLEQGARVDERDEVRVDEYDTNIFCSVILYQGRRECREILGL